MYSLKQTINEYIKMNIGNLTIEVKGNNLKIANKSFDLGDSLEHEILFNVIERLLITENFASQLNNKKALGHGKFYLTFNLPKKTTTGK